MNIGRSALRSCRLLLPLALALSGCPFSASDAGEDTSETAGAGGGAADGGTSGDDAGGSGGTGGASGGTGGTGGASGGTGGTGGASGGTGGTGGSLDFAEIDALLAQANHCESLDECVPVLLAPCSTRYVSAKEDVAALQAALDAWAAAEGKDELACDASCQCGLLTCTGGSCTTAEDSDCEVGESDTERMVCL
jgi:hypothetical protein